MSDRPITGEAAAVYLAHVEAHGLADDTAWLIDVGRFPVGGRVLDVGCGSGTLVAALAGQKQFARSVFGVELSPELARHARRAASAAGGTVVESDFLAWTPSDGWHPDTLVMSYFLHHSDDPARHLRRAAEVLPHGGRLYVLDRVAVDDAALLAFPRFWDDHYRAAHEWAEDMPRLMSVAGMTAAAREAGFSLVERWVCPHDRRAGAEGFPKTLMEFWRHEPGRSFPAVLVVSPAHRHGVAEVRLLLEESGLPSLEGVPVPYSDDLIRTVYDRCPWRDSLARFVRERCPSRVATALRIEGDDGGPTLLHRLTAFKRNHRDRWPSIDGPIEPDGVRPVILPFHVPEPYEAEYLAAVIGLGRGGGHRA